jgi:hypothetical protein
MFLLTLALRTPDQKVEDGDKADEEDEFEAAGTPSRVPFCRSRSRNEKAHVD